MRKEAKIVIFSALGIFIIFLLISLYFVYNKPKGAYQPPPIKPSTTIPGEVLQALTAPENSTPVNPRIIQSLTAPKNSRQNIDPKVLESLTAPQPQ